MGCRDGLDYDGGAALARLSPVPAMTMIHRFALIVIVVWSMGAAQAQTQWPDYIHTLKPDWSESPVAAVLPAGVVIAAPGSEVPAARARFSGNWQGWACPSQSCDVRVAVERLHADGATVAYAGADATGRLAHRGEAQFVAEELHLRLHTGARLVLRLRADGDMEMTLWRADAKLMASGVLTQRPLGPQRLRSVESLATPWTHQGQAVALTMVVYRPDGGPGPWPTVVMNHGSTGWGDRPERFGHVFTSLGLVRHFTQRGWQVIFPQRRGRGGSGGLYDEGFTPDRAHYSCDPQLSIPGFDRALEDLHLVMQHVLARPDVDARRVLLSGMSRGGILATAYAGLHPQQVAGVINFVGGWLGDICRQLDAINPMLFRRGATYPRAMLWLYGNVDSFFPLSHARANFAAFSAAGGQGRFVVYELPQGQDGHYIDGRPELWQGDVDEYLRKMGLAP
jgi:dienelactone hydrolase